MNISELVRKLEMLNENDKPKFGIMTPQHMVEHLTITIKLSNGRINYPPFTPSEKQMIWKKAMIETVMEFPKGIRAPGLNNQELVNLKFTSLGEAKSKLAKALEEYEQFFKENPDALTNHPQFGMMNHKEWEIFHPKHFKHHFDQFNIW